MPVCCVNSAFFLAMAAAASGNIALIVDGSRPELRLAPGDGGGRPSELRELSTFNLDMASFNRLDMASVDESLSPRTLAPPNVYGNIPFSPKLAGDNKPDIG